MNTNFKSDHPGEISRSSVIDFRGDVSRRIGNIRAVTLNGRIINANQILGAGKASQESPGAAFNEDPRDIWREIDRRAYKFESDAPDAIENDFEESGP